jgi:multiple sugar transport system ATP-binding protein
MAGSVKLDGISKAYGAATVLDAVTLDVQAGEFLSVVGASGCGKSTLLRIIAGLESQDAGRVLFDDHVVDSLSPRERNVAVVFQNYALYPHMTAFGNIATPLETARLSLFERLPLVGRLSPRRAAIMAGIARDVEAVAAQLHIEGLLKRKPGQMSGGQRQRVALARALVRRPSLFLMDEPLSNLDAQLRVHMRDEITQLHDQSGTTFIYVTHDQVEAMTMSDRIVMLDKGRIAQIGTPDALYDRPATLAVARFIGAPAMNLMPVEAMPDGILTQSGRRLPLCASSLPQAPLTLGLRPEHLVLRPVHEDAALVGRVRRIEHHGPDRLVHMDFQSPSGGLVTARVPDGSAAAQFGAGAVLAIGFKPQHAHLFDAAGLRQPFLACEAAGGLAQAAE